MCKFMLIENVLFWDYTRLECHTKIRILSQYNAQSVLVDACYSTELAAIIDEFRSQLKRIGRDVYFVDLSIYLLHFLMTRLNCFVFDN